MRCADCGAEWREIGSGRAEPNSPQQMRKGTKPASSGRSVPMIAGLPSFVAPSPVSRGASPAWWRFAAGGWRRLSGASAMLWLFAGLAIFFLVGQPFAYLSGRQLPAMLGGQARPVEISALSARQLLRGGRIAVSVEGRITNHSDRPMPMNAIEVVVSQAQGHRIYGWSHRPAIAFLAPGQSIRFMTAHGEVPETAASVEIRAGGVSASARL